MMAWMDDAAAHATTLISGDAPKQACKRGNSDCGLIAGKTNIHFSSSRLSERILWFAVHYVQETRCSQLLLFLFFFQLKQPVSECQRNKVASERSNQELDYFLWSNPNNTGKYRPVGDRYERYECGVQVTHACVRACTWSRFHVAERKKRSRDRETGVDR